MSQAAKLFLIFATGLYAAIACGQTPSFESELSWYSKYVWRGIVLDTRPALQSSHTITFGSLNFNIWSSGRTLFPAIRAGADEVDYTLGWETVAGPVTLTPSLSYYSYSEGMDSLEAGLAAEMELAGLTIFTNHYLDLRASNGAYFGEIGVSFERELSGEWALDAAVSVGWGNAKFNAYNLDASHSGLSVVSGQIGLTHRLGASFYLRPSLTASTLLDRTLRSAAERPDNLIFGITIGFRR